MSSVSSPKVSVIVPVYNVEEYLPACLDSILNQTLTDIEIIILNDGSPDNSEDVIRRYMDTDSRISYCKHDNMGIGLTRNKGISLSKGEYLSFIDSDDLIDLDMLETMYKKARVDNLDVVSCEVLIVEETCSRIDMETAGQENFILTEDSWKEFADTIFYKGKYRGWAWNKLYKREFIQSNDIVFGDNRLVFSEDLYFQFHIFMCNPLIGFVAKPFYHYMQRSTSITNNHIPDYFKKHLWIVNHFYELAEDNTDIEGVVSSIVLRGIINEAGHIIMSGQGFREFRKSISILYGNSTFKRFSIVNKRSRGREIVPFRRKRILSTGFCFFQRLNMKLFAELFIFYIRKMRV